MQDDPLLAPGTQLPVIAGWAAFPGFSRLWYRDAESNAEKLKVFDTLKRPNGYFFAIPETVERFPWEGNAVLCRTLYDTTSNGRPSAQYTARQRVRIRIAAQTQPLQGEWLEAVPDVVPPDIAERVKQSRRVFDNWVDARTLSPESRKRIKETTDPVEYSHALANTLLTLLPQDILTKAMQTADVGERLRLIQQWMEEAITLDPAKAILTRLGELEIPAEVRAKLDSEVALLNYTNKSSGEYEKLMTYLQFAASLPWGSRITPPTIGVAEARALLDSEHAGMEKPKKMVLDQLVTLLWWKKRCQQASPHAQPAPPPLRNLLLVGPPGTGKTTFLASLATALDRHVEIIPCGGISDIIALSGFERGYIGARVGAIMEAVTRAKTVNLVLGLDEIDKIGRDYRGDPYSVLMELTDPARNAQFTDRYLQFPFDLSSVLVIATANTLDPIPSSLQDRFDIVELRGYSFTEKLHMAREYVLPRLRQSLGLTAGEITINDSALAEIIEEYTYESGIRGLTRTLLTLLQRALADVLSSTTPIAITPAEARRYLGTPTVVRNQHPLRGEPGYSLVLAILHGTGMGEIGSLQVSLIANGAGQLVFSGFGDDATKDSAQVALSYLKLHAAELGIVAGTLANHDIHIHIAELGYPKRGPSAGLAILLGLLSALRHQPLPAQLAATGEIALDGRVLAVGGIPEKLVAAHRAGVATVLIPAANQAHLADVPEDVRTDLTVIPIATIAEAVAQVFPAG